MTSPLGGGWIVVKKFLPSAMAAALMYGAIFQIFETLKYPLTTLLAEAINALMPKAMPDATPLTRYGPMPARFGLEQIAIALLVFVIGSLIGLWVNQRSGHQSDQ